MPGVVCSQASPCFVVQRKMATPEFPAFFGDWLKQRRKILDLTQEEVAQRAGCSVFTLRKLEGGDRRPSKQLADWLAKVLEIPEEIQPNFIRAARGDLNLERLPLPTLAPRHTREEEASPSLSPFPVYFIPLVGREAELSALARIFHAPQCRLLTLTGLGGIGKTRLAVEFATTEQSCFPGGVYYVPLASLNARDLIVPAIADAFQVTLSGPMDPKAQLLNALSNRLKQPGLFVLDNMEHLLPGATGQNSGTSSTDLLVELLQRVPQAKFLVTSRERMNLQGEWTYELHGLPAPAPIFLDRLEEYSAPMLFLHHARRKKADFAISQEERSAVVRICQLLEGIPLAIELAATWVGVLSCEEIADEIEANIEFLSTAMWDIPERHRSLRATFDHSWKLLSEEEKDALCRLSIFRGGFDRSAAEKVANASLPILASLVSKSLVRRAAEGRYDLHGTIRQYSYEQLTKSGKLDETSECHFEFFLALAEESQLERRGAGQIDWLNLLDEDHDNLRTALEWSLRFEKRREEAISINPSAQKTAREALRLASALYIFWKRRSYWSEGREWLKRALAQSAFLPESHERVDAQNAAALLAVEQADTQVAHQLARANLLLSQELGEPRLVATALNTLGVVLWKQKRYVEARLHCEEGLEHFRKLGDSFAVAEILHSLGHIAINQDDYLAAQYFLDESLSISKALENKIGIVEALADLGLLAYLLNDYELAQFYLDDSLIRFREANIRPGSVSALNRLGDLARCRGDYDEAGRLYSEGLSLYRDLGDLDEIPSLLHNLGYVAQYQGDDTKAMSLFKEGLAIQQQMGNLAGIAECLMGIASVLSAEGQAEKGARLLGASEALRQSVGASLWPANRVEFDRILDRLSSSLDEGPLAAKRAEGQAMPIERAISEALDQV